MLVTTEEVTDAELIQKLDAFREWANTEKDYDANSGGVDKEDFLHIYPPEGGYNQTSNLNTQFIMRVRGDQYEELCESLGFADGRNAIWYFPKGMMDWHTNSNYPGLRTYYTYSEKESIFRWKDYDGVLHTYYETPNVWTKRTFEIPSDGRLFWHTIWSEGWRLSLGFNTPIEQRPLTPLS